MQVLYDPLWAYFLLETVDKDDGPTYPDPKQLDTLIETTWGSDTPPEPAGFLRPCVLEERKANCPSLQRHFTAPLPAEVQQQNVSRFILCQGPDLSIDPVEGKNCALHKENSRRLPRSLNHRGSSP